MPIPGKQRRRATAQPRQGSNNIDQRESEARGEAQLVVHEPRQVIEETAERILGEGPDPAVRVRLLRDVLARPATSPEFAAARQALSASRWVRLLEDEQRGDGGWGPFHTRDYRSKQRTPTTELGVERAVRLGLDRQHPVLRRAATYLTGILEGAIGFPDRDCRPDLVRLLAASTLAQIEAHSPAVDDVWEDWAVRVRSALAEAAESTRPRGPEPAGGHGLLWASRYVFTLLGARAEELPGELERELLAWVWCHPRGIGYIDAPLERIPEESGDRSLEPWLASLEMLSPFPSWRARAEEAVDWLWSGRADGLWDFGRRSDWWGYFPLSENWRRRPSRSHDWSTRVLALLAKYHPPDG